MMLKPAEIREMAEDELRQKIDSLRKELFELRTEVSSGRVEKPHRIRQAKRELARILTILKEKEKK